MIVLASESPRRRELLSMLGIEFEVISCDVDETTQIDNPKKRVLHLAQRKARAGLCIRPNDTVIGADTIVYASGQILEKPMDAADAARMIRLLSGKVHTVYTGVCILSSKAEVLDCCTTEVEFAILTEAEIAQYIKTEQVLDKAGAYAIQGAAAKFVSRIEGCYYNVMGLPVHLLYDTLKSFQR